MVSLGHGEDGNFRFLLTSFSKCLSHATAHDRAYGAQVCNAEEGEEEEEAARADPRSGEHSEEVLEDIGEIPRDEPPVRHGEEAAPSGPRGPPEPSTSPLKLALPTPPSPSRHGTPPSPQPRPRGRAADVLEKALHRTNARPLMKPQRAAASGGQGGAVPQRNRRVHPQNKYAERAPDFAALAARDAQLRPFVRLLPSGRGSIDFSSYEACRCAPMSCVPYLLILA